MKVTEERKQTVNEVLRGLIYESAVTMEQIAKTLGYPDGRYISAKLSSKNMTIDAIAGIADCLGYEVVLQPKTSGRRKEGQIVIQGSKGESK